MLYTADAAATLADERSAGMLYEMIEPVAAQIALPSVTAPGALARPLARLAELLGRPDDADRWFGVARELHERLRCPYLIAQTELDWEEVLLGRGLGWGDDRVGPAIERARVAAQTYGYGGIERRASRCWKLRPNGRSHGEGALALGAPTGVTGRVFADRRTAGRELAAKCAHLRVESPLVLGLPRGGVPVAFEIAQALDAPLDVIVVRKLGVPYRPELGMGAIGEGGVRVLNHDVIATAGVSGVDFASVEAREREEVERRARRYRGSRSMIPLESRTVIIVDDGIATGGTARAALQVARAHGATRVVLAVPVAPPDTFVDMATVADDVVVLDTPFPFFAIGEWYRDFGQTSDDEVVRLLATGVEGKPA